MADFLQYCNQFSPLDKATTDELIQSITTKTFQKGEYILKTGKVCRHLFFISEGLAKSFFNRDDKEFIMRFFSENELFSVFDSYITQKPSNLMIMALEPTIVTFINYERMEELCKKHHCMETFFRKLVSNVTIKMMKRITMMLEENATQRYKEFVSENKPLLQRINLGDLANYLGITQQSLSRIRAVK